MIRRRVRKERTFLAQRCASGSLLLLGLLATAPQSRAQIALGPVTLGAGLRTSYTHSDGDVPDSTDSFALNNARLYVNGPVTDKIKFMFNTDYDGATDHMAILDAVARFEFSSKFNIWAGRFLEPSDRANLYGPFYAHNWNVFTDGVQDGQPSVFQGRDNGVAYWGDFGKKVQMKISGGVFDGASAHTGSSDVIGAARVQLDFWDPEAGYYLNGTYYGDKNLLAVGVSTQVQSGNTATTVDFLMEKKLPNGGAFSIEGEYSNYNGLGGYVPGYKSRGEYGLASYIFPKAVGIGKFEILGKYAKADFIHGPAPSFNQKTSEVNLNYVIKQFNARIATFYKDVRFNRTNPNTWQVGVGLQIQM